MAIQRATCLVVVAHPDDCIILAGGFIQRYYKTIDFEICYLTYTNLSDRGKEIAEFWRKRNIPTRFLGYVDDHRDMERGISFDRVQARGYIERAVIGYDFVLTHAEDGDYGHVHHKFVHNCVAQTDKAKVYFSNTEAYNNKIVEKSWYTLDEIPLHSDVVKDEWSYQTGEYYYNITNEAYEIIHENFNTRQHII